MAAPDDTRALGAAMPDWLIQVIIQYPIVVIVGFVAWYASKRVERVLEARVQRAEELHDRATAQVKEAQARAAAEIKAEASALKDEVLAELKKVGKKLDELNRRLSP